VNGSESLRPQQDQSLESEKHCARGTADLIVDDAKVPPLLSEPQHGGHKMPPFERLPEAPKSQAVRTMK
jgi:hypothetical protein